MKENQHTRQKATLEGEIPLGVPHSVSQRQILPFKERKFNNNTQQQNLVVMAPSQSTKTVIKGRSLRKVSAGTHQERGKKNLFNAENRQPMIVIDGESATKQSITTDHLAEAYQQSFAKTKIRQSVQQSDNGQLRVGNSQMKQKSLNQQRNLKSNIVTTRGSFLSNCLQSDQPRLNEDLASCNEPSPYSSIGKLRTTKQSLVPVRDFNATQAEAKQVQTDPTNPQKQANIDKLQYWHHVKPKELRGSMMVSKNTSSMSQLSTKNCSTAISTGKFGQNRTLRRDQITLFPPRSEVMSHITTPKAKQLKQLTRVRKKTVKKKPALNQNYYATVSQKFFRAVQPSAMSQPVNSDGRDSKEEIRVMLNVADAMSNTTSDRQQHQTLTLSIHDQSKTPQSTEVIDASKTERETTTLGSSKTSQLHQEIRQKLIAKNLYTVLSDNSSLNDNFSQEVATFGAKSKPLQSVRSARNKNSDPSDIQVINVQKICAGTDDRTKEQKSNLIQNQKENKAALTTKNNNDGLECDQPVSLAINTSKMNESNDKGRRVFSFLSPVAKNEILFNSLVQSDQAAFFNRLPGQNAASSQTNLTSSQNITLRNSIARDSQQSASLNSHKPAEVSEPVIAMQQKAPEGLNIIQESDQDKVASDSKPRQTKIGKFCLTASSLGPVQNYTSTNDDLYKETIEKRKIREAIDKMRQHLKHPPVSSVERKKYERRVNAIERSVTEKHVLSDEKTSVNGWLSQRSENSPSPFRSNSKKRIKTKEILDSERKNFGMITALPMPAFAEESHESLLATRQQTKLDLMCTPDKKLKNLPQSPDNLKSPPKQQIVHLQCSPERLNGLKTLEKMRLKAALYEKKERAFFAKKMENQALEDEQPLVKLAKNFTNKADFRKTFLKHSEVLSSPLRQLDVEQIETRNDNTQLSKFISTASPAKEKEHIHLTSARNFNQNQKGKSLNEDQTYFERIQRHFSQKQLKMQKTKKAKKPGLLIASQPQRIRKEDQSSLKRVSPDMILESFIGETEAQPANHERAANLFSTSQFSFKGMQKQAQSRRQATLVQRNSTYSPDPRVKIPKETGSAMRNSSQNRVFSARLDTADSQNRRCVKIQPKSRTHNQGMTSSGVN